MARIPTRRSVTLPDPPDKYDAKDQRETRRILMETLGRPGGLASVTEDNITLTDTETNDVTSTAHGFAPKSPADATKFLNGAATPDYAAVKDSDLATTDVTTNDATDAKHGFLPKLSGNPDEYLNGDGAWVEIETGRVLPTFPTISGLELRLSAELSTITQVDGTVTVVTDISGNARNAANGSTNGKPRLLKHRFNGEFPALWFDGTNNDHLVVTMPNLAQPITVVLVVEELAVGTSDGNLYRDQSARLVGYLSGGNTWAIHGGTNGFTSAALYTQNRFAGPVTNGPTAIPCVRIDLYNGASSLISNNGVEVTGTASGSGTVLGGTFHIGNGPTAVSTAAKFLLYEILVYSVALTTQNRADIMAYYRDALDIPM